MRFATRYLTTLLLLAVYGGTSLLGYGLHLLAPDSHHHGLSFVPCAGPLCQEHSASLARSRFCEHENRPPADHAANPSVEAACSPCSVCEFLAQARSVAPQITTAIVWQHVVAEIHCFVPRLDAQTSLGPHAPRGPPLGG